MSGIENKWFVPKDIEATESSREKYEETETDLKNLSKVFKINNDSSDEDMEKYSEIRKGLTNEKSEIIGQAQEEAEKEDYYRISLEAISDRLINSALAKYEGDNNSESFLSDEFLKNVEGLISILKLVANGDLDVSVAEAKFEMGDYKAEHYGILAQELEKKLNKQIEIWGTKEHDIKSNEYRQEYSERQDAIESLRKRIKEL